MAKSARYKFKLFLLIVITLFWSINCATHKPGIKAIPKGQKFLFEVSRINFAWGFKHFGFYIDRQGRVNSFRYAKREYWQPKELDRFSEAGLMEKYSHNPELVCTLSHSELVEKFSLIDSAAMGPLTVRIHSGYDRGAKTFRAFQYDIKTGKYKPVLLKLEGDYSQENLSPSAAVLVKWLEELCNK